MEEKKRVFQWWRMATLLIFAAVLIPVLLEAQTPNPVPVTISGQKIVVEGKVYYMHQVLKGQTLYSIARAYAVSVDLLPV